MNSASPKTFYDEYPFDWVELYSPEELGSVISPLLLGLLAPLPQGALVCDVGCGPGRVMAYMANRGLRCIGLDRSWHSVQLMAHRCKRPGIVADNLNLPLPDASAELVISDGVIHHTPDARRALRENCRILRPGCPMYLAVYKPGGRYEFLYRYPGGLIRWCVRRPMLRWLVYVTALLAYYLAHKFKSGGKRTWRGARNLFYDYFLTPQVDFLSRETITQWCEEIDLELLCYDANPGGNVHSFMVRKRLPNRVIEPA